MVWQETAELNTRINIQMSVFFTKWQIQLRKYNYHTHTCIQNYCVSTPKGLHLVYMYAAILFGHIQLYKTYRTIVTYARQELAQAYSALPQGRGI